VDGLARRLPSGAEAEFQAPPRRSDAVCVGLIDSVALTRDCLGLALRIIHPDLRILSFTTVEECIHATSDPVEVILYHLHDDLGPGTSVLRSVKLLCEALPDIPVAVLSSFSGAVEPRHLREILAAGARGFIPSTTTTIELATAAVRLVRDGGQFVPFEILLGNRLDGAKTPRTSTLKRLTRREMEVLFRLRRGQPNKAIAYELGTSSNTIKVHIRNIMRKTGATNRTEVVYKSRQLWHDETGEA
jgi:DNA-binding NarL/FixJ family response regulator